jgi:hypothetical protein
MGSNRVKLILLVGLLIAWGAVVGIRFLSVAPEPPAAPAAGTESTRRPAAQGGGLPRLKSELLNSPRPPVPNQVQDIFGSALPPPTKAAQFLAPPAPAPAPPPPPPDPFAEEAKRLKYLGYVEQEGKVRALILQAKDIQILEIGEVFASRFRVKSADDEQVILASPDGTKEVRLMLNADAARPVLPGMPGIASPRQPSPQGGSPEPPAPVGGGGLRRPPPFPVPSVPPQGGALQPPAAAGGS